MILRSGLPRMPRPVNNNTNHDTALNQCVTMLASPCFLIFSPRRRLRSAKVRTSVDMIFAPMTDDEGRKTKDEFVTGHSSFVKLAFALAQLPREGSGLAQECRARCGQHAGDDDPLVKGVSRRYLRRGDGQLLLVHVVVD